MLRSNVLLLELDTSSNGRGVESVVDTFLLDTLDSGNVTARARLSPAYLRTISTVHSARDSPLVGSVAQLKRKVHPAEEVPQAGVVPQEPENVTRF